MEMTMDKSERLTRLPAQLVMDDSSDCVMLKLKLKIKLSDEKMRWGKEGSKKRFWESKVKKKGKNQLKSTITQPTPFRCGLSDVCFQSFYNFYLPVFLVSFGHAPIEINVIILCKHAAKWIQNWFRSNKFSRRALSNFFSFIWEYSLILHHAKVRFPIGTNSEEWNLKLFNAIFNIFLIFWLI